MGGAGLPGLIFAALLLLAVAAVLLLVVPWMKRQRQAVEEMSDPAVPTLDYEVPEGQDPAAVVTALHHDGLTAVGELRNGRRLVLIELTDASGDIRPRARSAIAKAALNLEGDSAAGTEVRFLDEL